MFKEEFIELLKCPSTGSKLSKDENFLINDNGHKYHFVQGIPVLISKKKTTLWVAEASYQSAIDRKEDEYHLDTLGLSKDWIEKLKEKIYFYKKSKNKEIDPVVSYLIGATSGWMYSHLIGTKLSRIPIPNFRLPPSDNNELLLDVGCSWGRWSIAAALAGYRVIGVDPSLGAVLAASRISKIFGVDHLIQFVVGDATQLPIKDNAIDVYFSYSVLQHFSKRNFKTAIQEASLACKEESCLMVQMPNALGIRSLYWLLKRGFREAHGFEVRYYFPFELVKKVESIFGPVKLSIDGILGLGIQPSDYDLMPFHKKLIIMFSESYRYLAKFIPPLKFFADSLYIKSVRKRVF